MGDTVYEDNGVRPLNAVGPAGVPEPGPRKAMLRIELRGAADEAARAAFVVREGEPQSSEEPESSESFAVVADRMTVGSGRLSLWNAEELVFRCPISALISVAFEVLDEPRHAPHPGTTHRRPHAAHPPHTVAAHPDGPQREAHGDLASANTRWTDADERRLLELHAAGVPMDALARAFGRRKGAVRARLFKLRHAREPDASAAPAPDASSEDPAGGPA